MGLELKAQPPTKKSVRVIANQMESTKTLSAAKQCKTTKLKKKQLSKKTWFETKKMKLQKEKDAKKHKRNWKKDWYMGPKTFWIEATRKWTTEKEYKQVEVVDVIDYWGEEVGEKILPITELEEIDDWGDMVVAEIWPIGEPNLYRFEQEEAF